MISLFGNLAELFSPSLFGDLTQTPRSTSTAAGMILLAGFMVLGGLLARVTSARLINNFAIRIEEPARALASLAVRFN